MKNYLRNNYHKYIKNRKLTTDVTVRRAGFFHYKDALLLNGVSLVGVHANTNRNL